MAKIVSDLKSDKRVDRVRAILAMEKIKSADVFPHLINLLKDPDPESAVRRSRCSVSRPTRSR